MADGIVAPPVHLSFRFSQIFDLLENRESSPKTSYTIDKYEFCNNTFNYD